MLLPNSNPTESMPGIQPPDFHALATPGLPSPTSLTSLWEISLPTIRAQGTEPLIKAINIQKPISTITVPPTMIMLQELLKSLS